MSINGDQRPHVLVVGGGLAGLTAAVSLSRQGVRVTVLEASKTLGGVAQSVETDGFLCESGAHAMAIPAGSAIEATLRELAIEPFLVDAIPRARRRLLFVEPQKSEEKSGKSSGQQSGQQSGTLVPMTPPHLLRLLGASGALRLLAEPSVLGRAQKPGDEGETVDEFLRRRFGARFAKLIGPPLVTGIYAGIATELGAADAFPEMVALEPALGGLALSALLRRIRSGAKKALRIVAPRRGFGEISAHFSAEIRASGGAVELGVRALAIEGVFGAAKDALPKRRSAGEVLTSHGVIGAVDGVILAVPPAATSELLRPISSAASALAREVDVAQIATVGLGFPTSAAAHPLDAYGFLAVDAASLGALAAVFESSVFPGRAPPGHHFVRVMLGGRANPSLVSDVAKFSDETLILRARAALERTIGLRGEPTISIVSRHFEGIPQYRPGHLQLTKEIRRYVSDTKRPIWLAGQAWDGVGTAKVMAQAHALSREVVKLLAPNN